MLLPKHVAAVAAFACVAAVVPSRADAALPTVPAGFRIDIVAQISSPRELVALPDGDVIVGTSSSDVYVLPNAEAATPGTPSVFATADDELASGVAFSARHKEIYIATNEHVWATRYVPGRRRAGALRSIAKVRTGPVAPHSDGDIHKTTSVAFSDTSNMLYVGVGSSCNACAEVDPTRASILTLPGGKGPLHKIATRIRNAIAMTISPNHSLWVGDAGQDDLPFGHPFEFLDNVTSHPALADYGWPFCEEDHVSYSQSGVSCDVIVAPLAELPAYSTIIGAIFYPNRPSGRYSFPAKYRGALFAAAHGSWHTTSGGGYAAEPQVAVFPMHGDQPAIPVDWKNSSAQWRTFVGGFQNGRQRVGRPTGLAVGIEGSLFVADDDAGVIYRIRPSK